jgi:hypothetical protein
MSSAYPWGARLVPQGAACLYDGEPPGWSATYYQDVTLLLPDDGRTSLPLGPVPERTPYGTVYPTAGPVSGWLWAEEQMDAVAAGAVILERRTGYCWESLGDSLAGWADACFALRQRAPDVAVAGVLKLASVAAIGRMGMDFITRTLVPYDGTGILYTDPAGLWSDGRWGIREEERQEPADAAYLMQVASYTHMTVRRALYARALPHAQAGRLISTNYDEVLYVPEDGTLPGHQAAALGGWKQTAYRNLIVRHPRWKEGDQWVRGRWERMSIRPGASRDTSAAG